MAQINLSISDLFQRAFGARGAGFDSSLVLQYPIDKQTYDDIDPNDETELGEFVNVRDSLKGTYLGRALFMPVKIRNLQLPNEPTMLISGRKNIVKTALAGSTKKGTVKELISVDDYDITIRGIVINDKSKLTYPEDIVKKIHELYLINESHFIECGLTSLLGIDKIVIESITFPEMIGIQHAQAYELRCVSDEDFELISQ
jgi:Domain of unknown function (DUF6046)